MLAIPTAIWSGYERFMATEKEKIHDRLAEVPAQQREGIITDVVENPYKQGETIRVVRATRDDPLAGLHARGAIDMAQLSAGRVWQRHWENAAIGAIRSLDTTQTPVDGRGPPPAPFTDKQKKACVALREAAVMLGYEGDRIVRAILGERASLAEVAIRHRRSKPYIGLRFREALETLARLWMLV
jgi:hypothetical protein